jgi:hypothetical protein
MENKYNKMTDAELIDEVYEMMYAGGKGKDCEICRIRGRKKKAYGEREIDGISYFLCWDCCLDTERNQRLKEKLDVTDRQR